MANWYSFRSGNCTLRCLSPVKYTNLPTREISRESFSEWMHDGHECDVVCDWRIKPNCQGRSISLRLSYVSWSIILPDSYFDERWCTLLSECIFFTVIFCFCFQMRRLCKWFWNHRISNINRHNVPHEEGSRPQPRRAGIRGEKECPLCRFISLCETWHLSYNWFAKHSRLSTQSKAIPKYILIPSLKLSINFVVN